mmetsp:Transcript_3639/g.4984  ORF Transcript_3639/g.4984 Transcript_3639/m.4984 type:complete len:813 (+) Transcript_3639:41-2479(+)
MGNSLTGAGALAAYEVIVPSVEYNNPVYSQLPCQLSIALHNVKKDEKEQKEKVCVFKFPKVPSSSSSASSTTEKSSSAFALRNIQKLRTLRHPFVVTYVDSVELDEANVLVTESCQPLETWLKEYHRKLQAGPEGAASEGQAGIVQELVWGFRCVLLALSFLHNTCGLLHGNLGLHAVFVAPSGDWKLGALELAANMATDDEAELFLRHQHLLGTAFLSPERASSPDLALLRLKLPPYYLDIYSLGRCMETAFALLHIPVPSTLTKYLTLMLSPDLKKRPPCNKLSQCAVFNSDYIRLLESIDELALKSSSKEALEVIAKLEPTVADISRSICAYKIMPNIARILQMAVNDFPNRDAREACRQSVQLSVSLVSKMSQLGKLDEELFVGACLPPLLLLWATADRAVRTVQLESLKNLAPLIPAAAVNKHIFDNMVAGFSDSNAKLRETTLMSLMYIVDKLEEPQLQDKLVRCIVSLQSDSEPSIRTNATIFLGRIASRLKDSVREKVLCAAFSKAMKDTFLHCRLAGLKTSAACVKLLDLPQLASKILPQAALLALDKSADLRELALQLLEAGTDQLRAAHKLTSARAAAAAASSGPPSSTHTSSSSSSSSSTNSSSSSSSSKVVEDYRANIGELPSHSSHSNAAAAGGWASWSVLQGLAKPQDPGPSSRPSDPLPQSPPPLSSVHVADSNPSWGDLDDDLDPPDLKKKAPDDLDDLDLDDLDLSPSTTHTNNKSNTNTNTNKSGGGGWGEDLDLDDPIAPSASPNTLHTVSEPKKKKPPASTASTGVVKKTKPVKVAVKKLEVAKDGDWDDF